MFADNNDLDCCRARVQLLNSLFHHAISLCLCLSGVVCVCGTQSHDVDQNRSRDCTWGPSKPKPPFGFRFIISFFLANTKVPGLVHLGERERKKNKHTMELKHKLLQQQHYVIVSCQAAACRVRTFTAFLPLFHPETVHHIRIPQSSRSGRMGGTSVGGWIFPRGMLPPVRDWWGTCLGCYVTAYAFALLVSGGWW